MASDHSEEQAAYDRFLKGDREAFEALYESHRGFLFRYAVSMTGSQDAADDLTQEVFVWLIHNRDTFNPNRGRLGSFLAGVMRKLLHRHFRRASRWRSFDDPSSTIEPQMAEGCESVENRVDAARLRNAIANLPVRYREAVILCDLEGLSYDAAAQLAKCGTGTLRSRLHRGRNMLVERFLNQKNERGRA